MNQIHYINGAEVKPPQNFAELSIELNFDTDSDEKGISVTRFDRVFGLGRGARVYVWGRLCAIES